MSGIIVAFPKQQDANGIKSLLVRSGFTVQGVCTTGAQAIQSANAMERGILVCGYKLPDMMCVELRENIPEQIEMLIIVSRRFWDMCSGERIMCLEMPLKAHELIRTLEMMTMACEKRRKQEKERPRRRTVEEKEWIQKAKLLLMEKNNLTEEEAYRYIQKNSMDSGNNMVETAQMLMQFMK